MKKVQKYILFFTLMVGTAALMISCEERELSADEEFSTDYDIPWIVSRITNVTPIEATPGTNITLTGENIGTSFVLSDGFLIGTTPCAIVSQTATSAVITVPVSIIEPSDISVRNLHNRTFVYEKQFIPEL
jgi:hypothetical protein